MAKKENIPRILLIDDDESIRLLLPMILERAGFKVETAEHGAAGLARLDAGAVDAILLDLMMPVMDGLHFLAEVRGRRGLQIPILVLSASINTHAGSIEDIIEAGATNVARKPIEAAELIALIRQMLEG